MVLYTIIPMEYIYGEEEDVQDNVRNQEIEIVKNGVTFLLEPMAGGRGKISRMISSNAQDYLNPDWQPGSVMAVF
jgi:hypothetical protein